MCLWLPVSFCLGHLAMPTAFDPSLGAYGSAMLTGIRFTLTASLALAVVQQIIHGLSRPPQALLKKVYVDSGVGRPI